MKIFHLRREKVILDKNKESTTITIPVATIGVEQDIIENTTVFKLAYCICNPKDNFSKKVGIIKVTGRLKSPRFSTYYTIEELKNLDLITVFLVDGHHFNMQLAAAVRYSRPIWEKFIADCIESAKMPAHA